MQIANLNSSESITTIELRELVNAARKAAGEPEVRNNRFVERVLDELEGEIEGAQKVHLAPRTKTEMVAYTLTLEQAMLVAMRESKAVRRSVVKQLQNFLELLHTSTLRLMLNWLWLKRQLKCSTWQTQAKCRRCWAKVTLLNF